MAENSKIEWCDHTFNPWIGCMKVSPACDNCYAEAHDKRFEGGVHWGAHAPRRKTRATNWKQPLKWQKQAEADGKLVRVFCASLADVFDNHKSIQPEWRAELWALIKATPNLDWLLLTKRPQNIARFLPDDWGDGWKNVWLGTTAENQEEADLRLVHLLQHNCAGRFVSCEPLLGEVDLSHLTVSEGFINAFKQMDWDDVIENYQEAIGSGAWQEGEPPEWVNWFVDEMGQDPEDVKGKVMQYPLDWVICGGESGTNARPMHPDWARFLRDQCAAAGVPFFFKQWGKKTAGRFLDFREHSEFPNFEED